ncbi:hypothetical protein Pcinc_041141 [Petrolisthes cinctipes]|uniref:Uncharacterized protein n=1 Tax=Petrolisthes cinctipes TaxID=88211 RepID=A0AAE1EI27_PETCI|nr:hypothetical protein Pcinc_041141 [Petrolisthes cinctipes]
MVGPLWVMKGGTNASVLPYFKKAEDYRGHLTPYNAEFHGRGGPIAVTPEPKTGKLAKAFLKAGNEMGYDVVDPNAAEQMGKQTYIGSYSYRQLEVIS